MPFALLDIQRESQAYAWDYKFSVMCKAVEFHQRHFFSWNNNLRCLWHKSYPDYLKQWLFPVKYTREAKLSHIWVRMKIISKNYTCKCHRNEMGASEKRGWVERERERERELLHNDHLMIQHIIPGHHCLAQSPTWSPFYWHNLTLIPAWISN